MTTPERERILFVTREFTQGGATSLALGHMRRLASRYEIDLLVTGPCDEKMTGLLPRTTTIFQLHADRLQSEALCADFYAEYRGAPVFQREYLAVLATTVFPTWHACFAVSMARAARKLVFLVDEGLATYPHLGPAERHAIDSCLAAADILVPVSRRLRERMAACCPPLAALPWNVLLPPLDVQNIVLRAREEIPPTRHAVPVVLTVSRLTPDKQVMQCLHIHHKLRQAGVEFQWHVAGTGPEEAALRAEIDRLDMGDVFHLLGYVENVYTLMQHCDAFALFSSSEGCPTAVMEALFLERPVIMTDVNGADELISRGHTGLIVSNEPGSIAEGLAWIVRDATLRERFRKNIAASPRVSDELRETTWLVEQIEHPPQHTSAPDASGPPEVSILIPAFNHGHCIGRAIAGALMQDFPSFEVIVADDASIDGTEAAARTWESDPRFRYVRNERNLGRVANYRNALSTHARGKWVVMLDGDDYFIDPRFIRRAWDSLQRHRGERVLFAQAGHRVLYTDGGGVPVDILPAIAGAERLMSGAEYLRFVFETGFFTHLGTMYDRAAAIEHGFYTADISSSDMDSLLRLALEGKVIVLNSIAGNWVQHGENASSNLPLARIPENARIFRHIARLAARRGLLSMPAVKEALTDYEARTLIHLFGVTVGRSAHSPLASLQMLLIMTRLNPRLLLHRKMMSSWYRYLRKLSRLALKRPTLTSPAKRLRKSTGVAK